jgi:hypothetical protein
LKGLLGRSRTVQSQEEGLMELYQIELEDAQQRLKAIGRSADDFSFEMSYLPPDPDGGGMFTVRYEVVIFSKKSMKSLSAIGGIGLSWVGYFMEALEEGHFD